MFPLNKGVTVRQAHVGIPEGLYEEEHGRDGFYGPVSHLYRTHAPTGWSRIEGPLKPRAFDCNRIGSDNADCIQSRVALLYNEDVVLHYTRPTEPMSYYFRNADGDEVYFIHEGSGIIETDFGPLYFEPGDYLVIPRGTTYRLLPETKSNAFLVIESFSRIVQPERGLLGQHALYDPTAITTPEPQPIQEDGVEWEVRVKRLNELTSVFYPFNPMDVVGWKGDLTVWQLNIRDFRPVMSHRAHLAPSVHTTFQGKGFVICSFVPRPLEEDPDAMRVPFYHRNIDYDEVLFYHAGNFFSRHGIDAGMITFHPQGIHHGPHPKAVAASRQKDRTDEVAVMLDAQKPLRMTPEAESAEWKEYYLSWQDQAETVQKGQAS
ncbi:MAG TPA: homogentisate 1,2-dioxygenase [Oculatellaceae cyanobacterium]|jgi:homogentisate 1,2-dioxygenase